MTESTERQTKEIKPSEIGMSDFELFARVVSGYDHFRGRHVGDLPNVEEFLETNGALLQETGPNYDLRNSQEAEADLQKRAEQELYKRNK